MSDPLPKGWARATLGEILTVIRGVTYKKEDVTDKSSSGFVPILRATNISCGLTFDGLVYVPSRYVDTNQLLRVGDIVIAASSGSRSVVGKAAQLKHRWKGSFGAFCFGLRPVEEIIDRFIACFLQTIEYRNRVSELAAGVNINNLRARHIEETPVRLAPLPEQHRIVEEIEKQFTRLEAGVAGLLRVQVSLKRYRSAVLKAACEGRLVPTEAELARKESRSYEPADKLLERILTERRAKWNGRGKYETPSAPDTGKLPELPEGWCWATVEQVADVQSGNTPSGIENLVSADGDIPWFKVGSMNMPGNEHHLALSDARLTAKSAAKLSLRIIPKGAFVFPKRGGAIATNKKRILAQDSCCDLNMMAIIPASTVAGYLWWWLVSLDLGRLSDGSNVPQINHKDIDPLPFPLPPLAEQQRIVAEVERRLSVVDELAAMVAANLKRADRLRQAILKRAFEGKLVPQDPKEEPAEKLLERISKERKSQSRKTRIR